MLSCHFLNPLNVNKELFYFHVYSQMKSNFKNCSLKYVPLTWELQRKKNKKEFQIFLKTKKCISKKSHIRTDEALICLCLILTPKEKKQNHKSRSHACFGRLDLGKGWAVTHGSNLQGRSWALPAISKKQ